VEGTTGRQPEGREHLGGVVGGGVDVGHADVALCFSGVECRRDIGQVLAGDRAVSVVERGIVGSAGAGENLAPFLVDEEEGLLTAGVVDVRNKDGPADVSAVDVVVNVGQAAGDGLLGVVVGSPVELVQFAVELLGAALERKAHGGARGDTVVRRVVRGHHVELSDGVLGRHDVHAAGAAAVIGFTAVDEPDVVALAKAVDADGEAGRHRGGCVGVRQGGADAEAESRECCEVAVFGGDFADLLGADEGGDDIGVGLHGESISLDGDGLVLGAYGELDVSAEGGGDVHHDSVLRKRLKAFGGDFQVVVCGVEAGDVVQPGRSALCRLGEPGSRVRERDFRARDDSSCLVCNDSRQLRVGLRECAHACHNKEQR